MTLIYHIKNSLLAAFLVSTFLLATAITAHAQSTVSLSVSPTLFEMSAEPGRTWQSSLRVINTNAFSLELDAEIVNFAPRDEGGAGSFIPLLNEEADANSLAAWISLEDTIFTVPPEQTITIPLSITVPADAAPGGHFAAVLIGTRKVGSGSESSLVETSQVVSSLLFLRVDGDVNEDARIRSFRSVSSILSRPETELELRIQNIGNVHVQPQGSITIYNMWGQERGVIPINRRSLFGNVLPDSVRKYSFGWTGEWSITDIGRYRAEAVLSYGQKNRQSLVGTAHFWVIPWKPLLLVLFILIAFVWLTSWAIKAYVRRMLSLAGVEPAPPKQKKVAQQGVAITKAKRRISISAPLQSGMLDLRSRFAKTSTVVERLRTLAALAYTYRQPLTGVLLLLIGLSLMVWFVLGATADERAYEVTFGTDERAISLTSEELKDAEVTPTAQNSNGVSVAIINRSGVVGLAATQASKLTDAGYTVVDMSSDTEADELKTVIVYDPAVANDALELREFFPNALLSAFTPEGEDVSQITIYVGRDQAR